MTGADTIFSRRFKPLFSALFFNDLGEQTAPHKNPF